MADYPATMALILNTIGDDRFVCDPSTTFGSLFDDGMEPLDYELALCAFELTFGAAFSDKVWDLDAQDLEGITIEQFIETYFTGPRFSGPIEITNRLLDLKDSILASVEDDLEDNDEEQPQER